MKKLITLILTLSFVFLTQTVYAESGVPAVDNRSRVVDLADFFSDDEEAVLTDQLDKMTVEYGMDFVVLTTDDALGLSTAEYADDFYEHNGYSDDGVLIIYDFDNYLTYLCTKGQANELLFDYEGASDEVLDKLNTDEYFAATDLYLSDLNEALASARRGNDIGTAANVPYEIRVPLIDGSPRVADFAGIFTDKEKEELEPLLQELSGKHGMDIIVVSTNDAGGLSSETYSEDFYNYNAYSDDVVCILYDFDNRYVWISTEGKGLKLISDYAVNLLLGDYMYEPFKDKKYLKATKLYLNKLDEVLTYGEQGSIIDVDNPLPTKFTYTNVIIGVVVGAVASLIYTLILRGQLKSVSKKHFATNYIDDGSFILNGHADFFVGSHVSKTPIQRNNSSGGKGGGGSSSHTSSSGSRHGGGGRSF